MQSQVSVIVTTYTAAEHVICCIKSLIRVSEIFKSEIEIVIYGDGGGAKSKEAIDACEQILTSASVQNVCRYNPSNLGIVPALNAACALATGHWLYIINDDMVFPYDWWSLAKPFLAANRVLSTSALEPLTEFRKPARCFRPANLGHDPVSFEFKKVDQLQMKGPLEIGVNYPFFVERKNFNQVGGGDEIFPGPYHDPDLFHRFRLAGLELLRTPNLAPYHFSGISLRQINKGTLPSLNWVQRENAARLMFIKKWGCKPKAKFGEIPKVKNLILWNDQSHNWKARIDLYLLLIWEQVRCAWRLSYLKCRLFFQKNFNSDNINRDSIK
jgi:glycosyltransferase involved in cell wall biosynthesis